MPCVGLPCAGTDMSQLRQHQVGLHVQGESCILPDFHINQNLDTVVTATTIRKSCVYFVFMFESC